MTANEIAQLSEFTRVAVVSDTQGPDNPLSVWEEVAAAMLTHEPSYILHNGDVRATGADYETEFWPALGSFPRERVLATPGNHDDNGDALAGFLAAFPHLSDVYWQQGIGKHLRVYGINSSGYGSETDITSTGPQAVWLQAQAALYPEQWKIVITHRAPYSNSTRHGAVAALRWGDGPGEPYENIDFHLNGHNHGYERLEVASVVYISGPSSRGALPSSWSGTTYAKAQSISHGFCIIDVNMFKLHLRYFNKENVLVDEVVLRDRYQGLTGYSMKYTFVTTDGLANSLVAKSAPGKLYSMWGVTTNQLKHYIQIWDEAAVADIDGSSTLLHTQVLGPTSVEQNFAFYATQNHEVVAEKGICVVNSSTMYTYTAGAADCWIAAKVV